MNDQPVRMALAVPPVGTALNGSGEAYIASLRILAECGEDNGGLTTDMDGDVLESLLMAVNLRSFAFNARTFAFNPFSVDGAKFGALLERNWSSVDSSGPDVVALAKMIMIFGEKTRTISFRQIN